MKQDFAAGLRMATSVLLEIATYLNGERRDAWKVPRAWHTLIDVDTAEILVFLYTFYACHCGRIGKKWTSADPLDGRQTRNLLTLRVSSIHVWIKQPETSRASWVFSLAPVITPLTKSRFRMHRHVLYRFRVVVPLTHSLQKKGKKNYIVYSKWSH
jgi:hypothetical protein